MALLGAILASLKEDPGVLLSRRQARTALAATAGAACYLAASELGARKIRLSALWILSSAAMAGMASVSGTSKARAAHKRIDVLVPAVAGAVAAAATGADFVNGGGTVGGDVHVTGDHHIGGYLYGAAGSIQVGDTLGMLTNISMNGHPVNMFGGDITGTGSFVASTIGPGGSRGNLGAGATLAQVQARCDWITGTLLAGANIMY